MAVILGSSHHIAVAVDGVDVGAWDVFDGGNTPGNAGRYRPSGGKQVALRGRPTTEDVTVRVGYDPVRHNVQFFRDRVGKQMSVTIRPRDDDGNPFGEIDTYVGLLEDVERPGSGADPDDTDPAMLGLVMAAHQK